jgi:hypothetical protein
VNERDWSRFRRGVSSPATSGLCDGKTAGWSPCWSLYSVHSRRRIKAGTKGAVQEVRSESRGRKQEQIHIPVETGRLPSNPASQPTQLSTGPLAAGAAQGEPGIVAACQAARGPLASKFAASGCIVPSQAFQVPFELIPTAGEQTPETGQSSALVLAFDTPPRPDDNEVSTRVGDFCGHSRARGNGHSTRAGPVSPCRL